MNRNHLNWTYRAWAAASISPCLGGWIRRDPTVFWPRLAKTAGTRGSAPAHRARRHRCVTDLTRDFRAGRVPAKGDVQRTGTSRHPRWSHSRRRTSQRREQASAERPHHDPVAERRRGSNRARGSGLAADVGTCSGDRGSAALRVRGGSLPDLPLNAALAPAGRRGGTSEPQGSSGGVPSSRCVRP